MSYELFSLKGKVALVTGAGGLLGKYHCTALLNAGAVVIASDLSSGILKNAFPDSNTVNIEMDITDSSSVEKAKNNILMEFGRLDILVNNAAINDKFEPHSQSAELSKFENFPLDLWEKSIKVNLTGTFISCKILGAFMAQSGSGSIINIASTYGIVAPDQKLYKNKEGHQNYYKSVSYPVTKAAVISLTRYLAAYWGGKGVRVNCISPGGVKNNQEPYFIENYSKRTPLGRMAEPEDYMGALVFLASDASAYVNGENLVVDGGFTIW